MGCLMIVLRWGFDLFFVFLGVLFVSLGGIREVCRSGLDLPSNRSIETIQSASGAKLMAWGRN